MNEKYYALTVINDTTGEIFTRHRFAKSEALALSVFLRKFKNGMTEEEKRAAKLYCTVYPAEAEG